MNICLLTYRGNPYCGGQGVYVCELGRALAQRGHQVHCVTGPPYPPPVPGITWHRLPGLPLWQEGGLPPGAPGLFPERSALAPLALYERAAAAAGVFPELAAFSLRAFHKVRELAQRIPFDVLHDNQTLGWGLLPLKELGVPLVATIHHPLTVDRERGFDPPSRFARQWQSVMFFPVLMQGYVARRMRTIITVSEASVERIARDFRVPRQRIRRVYNGVDAAHFRPRPEIPRVPGRVLYVGNVEDRNKGFRYLLHAAAHLDPRAHLVVATGQMGRNGWVRQSLRRLGLEGRVEFRVGLDAARIAELYASAEVAVCSSLFEGFGFPAAEAMATGLPIVSTSGGALPEVVGEAGVLVPPAQPQALAEAVNALLADPARRRELGQAARRRVLEHFQWDQAAAQVEAVYREAIHAHR